MTLFADPLPEAVGDFVTVVIVVAVVLDVDFGSDKVSKMRTASCWKMFLKNHEII